MRREDAVVQVWGCGRCGKGSSAAVCLQRVSVAVVRFMGWDGDVFSVGVKEESGGGGER